MWGQASDQQVKIEKAGNGSFVWKFSLFHKVIAVIALLLSFVIPLASLYGSIVLAENELKIHGKKIVELSEANRNMVELIGLIQKQIAVQEVKIDGTRSDISEIKADIKSILRAIKA